MKHITIHGTHLQLSPKQRTPSSRMLGLLFSSPPRIARIASLARQTLGVRPPGDGDIRRSPPGGLEAALEPGMPGVRVFLKTGGVWVGVSAHLEAKETNAFPGRTRLELVTSSHLPYFPLPRYVQPKTRPWRGQTVAQQVAGLAASAETGTRWTRCFALRPSLLTQLLNLLAQCGC